MRPQAQHSRGPRTAVFPTTLIETTLGATAAGTRTGLSRHGEPAPATGRTLAEAWGK